MGFQAAIILGDQPFLFKGSLGRLQVEIKCGLSGPLNMASVEAFWLPLKPEQKQGSEKRRGTQVAQVACPLSR